MTAGMVDPLRDGLERGANTFTREELALFMVQFLVRCPRCGHVCPAGFSICLFCLADWLFGGDSLPPPVAGVFGVAAATALADFAQRAAGIMANIKVQGKRTIRGDFTRAIMRQKTWRRSWSQKSLEDQQRCARESGNLPYFSGAGVAPRGWIPAYHDDRPPLHEVWEALGEDGQHVKLWFYQTLNAGLDYAEESGMDLTDPRLKGENQVVNPFREEFIDGLMTRCYGQTHPPPPEGAEDYDAAQAWCERRAAIEQRRYVLQRCAAAEALSLGSIEPEVVRRVVSGGPSGGPVAAGKASPADLRRPTFSFPKVRVGDPSSQLTELPLPAAPGGGPVSAAGSTAPGDFAQSAAEELRSPRLLVRRI